MAWTYTGDPASSNKDAVRFLVGDTKSDDPLATDEEIEWCISKSANVYWAAVSVAKSIAAYFARLAEVTQIDTIRIDYGKRAETYALKALELQRQATQNAGFSIYGGAVDNDAQFTIGMDDNKGTTNE